MIFSRLFLPLVCVLLIVSSALGDVIRDGSFTASSDGRNITIRWVSEDESGVLRYEVERKAGVSGQFFFLAQVPLLGSNSSYVYVDESAFRATASVYQYRLKVIFANGTSVYYGPITVTHSVSSVRRTWGSIKAMFR